ncbi:MULTISPECIES: potassium channel family protein [Thermococcus]|uniref:Ion channel protein n=1 Tax=Thermococcus barossii TaxID=54077 RepID=A0A2Z2MER3_9EURY|nr:MULTISPECIES: potassium channel family protein [Thermococcus]ASJ04113.1 Ion channel protein [Thermococcus barossii]NJE75449.1 two pore domain potassium channel family protein [Thermococcus sp. ES12]
MGVEDDFELVGFRTFFTEFLRVIYYVRSILAGLFGLITLLGVVMSLLDGLTPWQGVYLAFVSAFTVGYGDITPKTPASKFLAVIILPILGMILTGIMVAAAMKAIERLYRDRLRKF